MTNKLGSITLDELMDSIHQSILAEYSSVITMGPKETTLGKQLTVSIDDKQFEIIVREK